MIDLLDIPKNNSKNVEDTKMVVFGIKINTKSFIARLLNKKPDETIKATSKVLAKQLVTFLDIQFLVEFLSFYSQAVCLERVFI